jgi:hypothetical protein
MCARTLGKSAVLRAATVQAKKCAACSVRAKPCLKVAIERAWHMTCLFRIPHPSLPEEQE